MFYAVSLARFGYNKTFDQNRKTSLKEKEMAPFYAEMCDELGQQVDKALLSDLKQKNKDKLAVLDKKIADAEELEGLYFIWLGI